MNALRHVLVFFCLIGFSFNTEAQVSTVAKLARELVDVVIAKGGQQAARELAALGGESLARETLEAAVKEGGEALAQKLSARTIEYGPALLRVAKPSPAKFLSAFDELSPAVQRSVAQAMAREPELMANLFFKLGKESLVSAAKHPGVGTKVMDALGSEGAEALGKMSTDQAIQLGRITPQLARLPDPKRRGLLEMIGKAPGRTLELLERNPNVLRTGALVGLFLANQERILGGAEVITDANGNVSVVEKPGFVERLWKQTAQTTPISVLFWVMGLILCGWGAVKIWGAYRVEKAKVRHQERHLEQARKPREKTSKPA